MKSVGNSGSTLVFSLETVSVYLDAVRIKAPGSEVFSPMGFDTNARIYIAAALENLAAEVLELGGNKCSDHWGSFAEKIWNAEYYNFLSVNGYYKRLKLIKEQEDEGEDEDEEVMGTYASKYQII